MGDQVQLKNIYHIENPLAKVLVIGESRVRVKQWLLKPFQHVQHFESVFEALKFYHHRRDSVRHAIARDMFAQITPVTMVMDNVCDQTEESQHFLTELLYNAEQFRIAPIVMMNDFVTLKWAYWFDYVFIGDVSPEHNLSLHSFYRPLDVSLFLFKRIRNHFRKNRLLLVRRAWTRAPESSIYFYDTVPWGAWMPCNHSEFPVQTQCEILHWLLIARVYSINKNVARLVCTFIATSDANGATKEIKL